MTQKQYTHVIKTGTKIMMENEKFQNPEILYLWELSCFVNNKILYVGGEIPNKILYAGGEIPSSKH